MSLITSKRKRGKPPKPQKAKAIELIKQQYEQTGKIDASAIAQQTGYTPKQIRVIAKEVITPKLPSEEEPKPETITPEKPTIKITPITTTPTEITPLMEEKPIEEIVELWTPEEITSLFEGINSLFPPQHQRPKEAMQILGKAWSRPLNRWLKKYENEDVYIALVTTIIVFAPSIAGILRERFQKPKTEKPKEPETKGGGKFGEQSFQPT